jgi:4-amino-4-deoxy-L-arabinose transferase-like glycosyltransferase
MRLHQFLCRTFRSTETHQVTHWLDRLSTGFRPYLVIGALLLACALPGFFALQPLDRDESRFAQATSQMFESGDFIRISFQDEPRNKKPIGIHWLQAASVSALGGAEARNIQAFRIPSLLGALLCAFATFKIGALLYGRREGLIGGAAIACGLLLSTEAGIAKTDAALAGFIALAYLGLAGLRTITPPKWAPWFFWIGVSAAALIKGPIGPLIIILSIVMLAIWERGGAWLKRLVHWPSITLALAIVVPWYMAIWQATGGQFFTDAIGQDLAPKLAGKSENPAIPPGAHLLLSPLIMWPGSVLLPAAIWTGWTLRKDLRIRFLLAWVIPGWLLFEAAPAKLAHYTLPVHGAIVLLGAIGLLAGAWQRKPIQWISLGFVGFGGLILAAMPVALADDIAPSASARAVWYSAAIALATLIAIFMIVRKSAFAALSLVTAAIISSIAIKGLFVPSLPELNISARVSQALTTANLHPRLSAGQPGPLIGVGYQEPSLIFATRSDSALSSLGVATQAAKPGSGVVVSDDNIDALTSALAEQGLAIQRIENTEIAGTNYSKGDPVTLLIGRVVAKP